MRIKHQLFLGLLGANALVILLMFLVSSWSFNRGFLEYVNQVESRRLAPVVDALAAEYDEQQSFDRLVQNKRAWRDLQSRGRAGSRPGKRGTDRSRPGVQRPPTERERKAFDPNSPATRAPPPGSGLSDPRLLLADQDKTVLIGSNRDTAQIQWKKIEVNDAVVGYLGFRPLRRLSQGFDRVFARQQQRDLLFAALLLTGVSAVLAILLSARLVKPILAIDESVRKISEGDFRHRLDIKRQDELGDLSGNVNLLGRTLEKNLSARQQWIAEISHELRTPVAVLRGELEAMQDGIRQMDKSALDSLHAETMRLNRLVNDLHDLSLSDLGALSYSMQAVNVEELIEACKASHKADADEKQLRVSVRNTAAHCVVTGDIQRLSQLFSNLMQNSIRYTGRGGSIDITLASQQNALSLDWSDSAPGVAAEHIPHLFEALYRTEDSRNRESGGSGLGLAIAEKIVLAHEGTISAGPSASGGLSIAITFPLARRETA